MKTKLLAAILVGGTLWVGWEEVVRFVSELPIPNGGEVAARFSSPEEDVEDALEDVVEIAERDSGVAVQDNNAPITDLFDESTEDSGIFELPEGSKSIEAWREFASDIGLECDAREIGLGLCISGKKVYSAKETIVEAPVGARGWVESRQVAAVKAELQAKDKIIFYIENKLKNNQSLGELEDFNEEVGDSEQILPEERGQWEDFRDRVEILSKKGADFVEATLDQRIEQADPFYNSEQYKKMPLKRRAEVARNRWKQKTVEEAEELLRGAVAVFSHESLDAETGKSRVLVVVAWSPVTERVAASMIRGDYNVKVLNPDGVKGLPAKSQISKDKNILLGAFGGRLFLDENGEHYVLAFSQAEVRRSQSRQEQALKSAQEVAELRAKGIIARFAASYEESKGALDDTEDVSEFTDQSNWRQNRREYTKRIKARTKLVKLRGLRLVKTWAERHPATNQIVVGAVVRWSPADSRQADKIFRGINSPSSSDSSPQAAAPQKKEKRNKDYQSKPLLIDLGAY